jgi:hypothetical protein
VPAALYSKEGSWYSYIVEAESIPAAIARLEGLGKLKNQITSSEIEPATKKPVLDCSLLLARSSGNNKSPSFLR